ncbi:MAG: quinolinate synthase NadA, partial [candidate division WOR-3 bacterium]|nr:quinolinate synthase NadA [candidate division WOR-3 bacterium]
MSDIAKRIVELKKERNAAIIAHNYQLPEIQDIADYLGDSLGLSRKSSELKEDVIVFCGVKFMAETAKILSPQKTVLIPDIDAGCNMAGMVDKDDLQKLQGEHPDAKTV